MFNSKPNFNIISFAFLLITNMVLAQPPSCTQCEDPTYLISNYGCQAPCNPGDLPAGNPQSWDDTYAACMDAECNNVPMNQNIFWLIAAGGFVASVTLYLRLKKTLYTIHN